VTQSNQLLLQPKEPILITQPMMSKQDIIDRLRFVLTVNEWCGVTLRRSLASNDWLRIRARKFGFALAELISLNPTGTFDVIGHPPIYGRLTVGSVEVEMLDEEEDGWHAFDIWIEASLVPMEDVK
jgi:hypothetical protein